MYGLDLAGLPTALYERISDDREGKRLGVKRQDKDGRKLIAKLDLKLVEEHVYTDNDISAGPTSKKYRADYERMLQAVRDRKIEVVVAYSTSRLTRRPREAEDLIDLALEYGLILIFVKSPYYDLTTADGREAFRKDAARDTGEVDRLQERIARQKLEDAEGGLWNGGTRTYGYGKVVGYDPVAEKDILDYNALVEHEVEVLKECKPRTLGGESSTYIVRDLNTRGEPSAKGKKWTQNTYKRTMLLERYVIFDAAGHDPECTCLDNPEGNGTRLHHEERHRAVWPGIFTTEDHEMLRTVFGAINVKWSNNGKIKGRTYLLSGLTECGGAWPDGRYCGADMYGQGKKYGGKYVRRYAGKKWNNHGEQVCCNTVFRIAEPVELLVSEAVLERFDSPEVAKALAGTNNEMRVTELVQTIAKWSRRKDELAAEHAMEPLEGYRTMVATLKGQIEDAQNELTSLRSEKAKSLLLPKEGGLRNVWKTASMEWKHAVIRLIVEKVVITPCRPGSRMWPNKEGWRFDPSSVTIKWLH